MHLKCLLFCALSVAILLFHSSKTHAEKSFSANPKGTNLLIENKGQITDQFNNSRNDIDFRLVGKGVNLFVGSGHLHYQWSAAQGHSGTLPTNQPIQMYRMDIDLVGANRHAQIIREEVSNYYETHYTSSGKGEPARSYQRIIYKDIYANVDWIIYIKNGVPEYDFVIHPGGKVSDIVMSYSGQTSLNLQGDGSLKATTPMGEVIDKAPIAFQDNTKPVNAEFAVRGKNVRFIVDAYEGTLTIDPTIDWGTYFGGALSDQIYQTVCDDSGYVYVTGSTASIGNIATTGSFQTSYGGGTGASNYLGDAFIAKFNSSGQCLWSTYYGGTGADQGMSLALDTARNIYLTGFTQSTANIATTGSYQDVSGGGADAFLAKFNNSGSRLWATYYGGSGNENIKTSVSCDTFDNVYLSGITNSSANISSPGAYQTTIGGSNDAFLVKFNSSGVRQWATYYGGSGSDIAIQHANDIYGNVYLSGYTTSSSGIASIGAHLSTAAGGEDGFLAKFNGTGQRIWSTYFGGSLLDRSLGVACDDSTHIFMTGITRSTAGIATSGAHLTTYAGGTQDAFLTMFDSSGVIQWGTYFGGADNDAASSAICKGILGSVYIGGQSLSTAGIATSNGMSNTISGIRDAYIANFDHDGQQKWGSYVGGLDVETAYGVAADPFGNLYVAGQTNSSSGIATTGGYQPLIGGGAQDGFLIKIFDCDTPAQPVSISGPTTVCKGSPYKFFVPQMPGITSYTWTLPSGWSGTSITDTIVVIPGASNGSITVTPNTPCISGPSQSLAVVVDLVASITPSGYHEICNGDSIVLSANAGTGLSWQWLYNGGVIAGATTSILAAKADGLYTIAIQNANCTDTSVADTIKVNPLPQPVISLVGSDLITSVFATYQWYHIGNPVIGAVAQTYTPLTDGHYAVSVTDNNGCSGMSAYFAYGDVTAVSEVQGNSHILVYPNPATDYLHVQRDLPYTFKIVDALGKNVMEGQGDAKIDVRALPAGLYLLQCYETDQQLSSRSRFIKK